MKPIMDLTILLGTLQNFGLTWLQNCFPQNRRDRCSFIAFLFNWNCFVWLILPIVLRTCSTLQNGPGTSESPLFWRFELIAESLSGLFKTSISLGIGLYTPHSLFACSFTVNNPLSERTHCHQQDFWLCRSFAFACLICSTTALFSLLLSRFSIFQRVARQHTWNWAAASVFWISGDFWWSVY